MPGQPVAAVGSMTVHGGVVTGPGVPNVLVNGQPIAVQGDMHACPLCDPPGTPHVGGPIADGVPTP